MPGPAKGKRQDVDSQLPPAWEGAVRGSEACGAGHAVLSDTQNIPVPISFPNPQRQAMSSVSQKTQDNSVPPRKSLERTEEDRSFPPAADKPVKSPVINRENHTRAFLQCQRTPASQTQRWRTRLQQSPTRCASEYLDLKLDFTVIEILRKHLGKQVLRTQTKVNTILSPLLPSLIKGPVLGLISSLNLLISDPVNLTYDTR